MWVWGPLGRYKERLENILNQVLAIRTTTLTTHDPSEGLTCQ